MPQANGLVKRRCHAGLPDGKETGQVGGLRHHEERQVLAIVASRIRGDGPVGHLPQVKILANFGRASRGFISRPE